MTVLDSFHQQQYLNLETFRRNSQQVRTPVWFVQENDSLFVRTIADSGKVKRIRNYPQVRIVPCKVDGTPLGDWMEAKALLVNEPEMNKKVDRLLGNKYGLMKSLFGLAASLNGQKYTVIQIKVT